MIRIPLVVTVFVALVATGVVDGIRADRWGQQLDLREAAARFDRIPLTVGEWTGQPLQGDEAAEGIVGPTDMRRYVHRSTGTVLSVVVNVGRPGAIFVNHTPLDCYPPSGWNLSGEPKRHTVSSTEGAPSADFWVAQFDKAERAMPLYSRVYWSWSGDGHWQVPDSPRLTFARFSVIYKLYVVRLLAKPDEPLDEEPADEFIRLFVPELQKVLFRS
jgi:hypothetical protein